MHEVPSSPPLFSVGSYSCTTGLSLEHHPHTSRFWRFSSLLSRNRVCRDIYMAKRSLISSSGFFPFSINLMLWEDHVGIYNMCLIYIDMWVLERWANSSSFTTLWSQREVLRKTQLYYGLQEALVALPWLVLCFRLVKVMLSFAMDASELQISSSMVYTFYMVKFWGGRKRIGCSKKMLLLCELGPIWLHSVGCGKSFIHCSGS